MRNKKESLDARIKQAEDNAEAQKKEKEHETLIKREVRKLKEEDIKVLSERVKRKEQIKKLYIIEKDLESINSVERIRLEKEKLVQANVERRRWQSVERQHLIFAVGKLSHLQSPSAREKYLRNSNFDESFIKQIKSKLPMLFDNDSPDQHSKMKHLSLPDIMSSVVTSSPEKNNSNPNT